MAGLVMVGLSHHVTPLDVRERVSFDDATWRLHAAKALSTTTTTTTILLSTCNRVEVYAWVERRSATAVRALQRSLARAAGVPLAELQPYIRSFTGHDALVHLVRVTSGLDSLVVGEEQIRGQVREALRMAEASGPLPHPLRGIFQRVGESARRVRSQTSLGKAPSIASAGVNVAVRSVPGGVRGKLGVVLGAGVMARAAAEALLSHGAQVRILNRTPAHAERLISQLGSAIASDSLEALAPSLAEAALIVGATASRVPVITVADVAAALQDRPDPPLVLLDIALPRDIEPSARELNGVHLIDLDDLERLCPVDIETRRAEHSHAEALAIKEADRLTEWLRSRAVSPFIAELRTYAESIRAQELRRSAARLRDLTPEQIAAVEALTAGIVNKLMHGPTLALRDAAASPGGISRSHRRILRVLRSPRERTA